MHDYLFSSARMGFRNWRASDLQAMTEINQDAEVMKYFPDTQSATTTAHFIERMQSAFEKYGYCYFAVDHLKSGELIGFIGLCWQDYQAKFTPCTDIGWRLKRTYWGQGLATEGATRCTEIGFKRFDLHRIYSVAVVQNKPSIHVMQKIGMKFMYPFKHSTLKKYPLFENCVLYVLENPNQ